MNLADARHYLDIIDDDGFMAYTQTGLPVKVVHLRNAAALHALAEQLIEDLEKLQTPHGTPRG